MTVETDLDHAHQAMQSAPDDDAARLRFFERLADTELFLLLEAEPTGDAITPHVFDVGGAQFALVFDRAERLTAFTESVSPYAALSGRGLVEMMAGQGVGLALNPQVAPSEMLIPAEALEWLRDTLAQGPQEAEARISEIAPPPAMPETVLTGLDRKLATAGGRARQAWLVEARYDNGSSGPLLVFLDAAPGAEGALAKAVGEALTFSGVEAGAIDVSFAASTDTLAASLARVGLRFDLPQPETPKPLKTPGSDPNTPPILR